MYIPVEIVFFITTVVGILSTVLFFKVWGMTNNVKHLLNYTLIKDGYEMRGSVYQGVAVHFVKKEE